MFLQNLFILRWRGWYPGEQAPPRDAECMSYALIHKCALGLR